MTIDWGFISALEGGRILEGYVPASQTSRSGVTVATGFDIGQRSADELERMDLPADLIQRLKPYAGLVRDEAVEFLARNPLSITEAEAEAIDREVKGASVAALTRSYDGAVAPGAFDDLPDAAQTVIASVAFQYGDLKGETPKFWAAATGRDWTALIAELEDFRDDYPTRRGKEADYLRARL